MKYATMAYPIYKPFHSPYAKLSIFPYIFSHLRKFFPLFCSTNKLLWYRPNKYGFASKAVEPLLFKIVQHGYETFQNVAPILHSVICSEMCTSPVTIKKLL